MRLLAPRGAPIQETVATLLPVHFAPQQTSINPVFVDIVALSKGAVTLSSILFRPFSDCGRLSILSPGALARRSTNSLFPSAADIRRFADYSVHEPAHADIHNYSERKERE